MLDDKIIRIWTIMYDYDVNQAYTFLDFDKAVESISSSARSFLDGRVPDSVFDEIVAKVKERRHLPYIPMQFDSLEIVLFSVEMDKHSILHKTLCNCYKSTRNKKLREEISSLFVANT